LSGLLKSLRQLNQRYGDTDDAAIRPVRDALRALDPDNDLYCGNRALLKLLQQINASGEQLSEQLSARFFSYTARLDQSQNQGMNQSQSQSQSQSQ
jgi:hypothetical protein